MKERPIRVHNYLAYGLGDVLGGGAMAIISAWVLFFYTTYCDLSALQAAFIFSSARIIDAVASPLIGYISDNADSSAIGRRFGRRRIFLLVAIPLLPSFALMWVDGQTFLYYLLTYVFFELVYASFLIPYETLAAEMTHDFRKKGMFAGIRILTSHLAAISGTIMPAWIVSILGGKDSPDTFLIMGGIFSVAFMLVVSVVYFFTWERFKTEAEIQRDASKHATLKDVFVNLYKGLWVTLRIRAFRLHLGMYLGGYISQDIFNAAFTYFAAFVLALGLASVFNLGGVSAASILMALIFTVQAFAVAGVFLAVVVLPRFYPARVYRLAVISYALGIVGLATFYYFIPEDLNSIVLWLALALIFAGVGRGLLNYIPWNTYNYMPDVDQIVTGRRREGSFAGVMTFVRKAAQSLAVIAVGAALDWGGLVKGAGVQQSEHTMQVIVWTMVVGPMIVLAFGFWVSTKFHLDTNTHAILMMEIERLQQGNTSPSDERARTVVEDLTGWPYEKLWGRNNLLKSKNDAGS